MAEEKELEQEPVLGQFQIAKDLDDIRQQIAGVKREISLKRVLLQSLLGVQVYLQSKSNGQAGP